MKHIVKFYKINFFCFVLLLLQENLSQETLDQQFRIVRSETNHSTPTEYGDMVSSWFSLFILLLGT